MNSREKAMRFTTTKLVATVVAAEIHSWELLGILPWPRKLLEDRWDLVAGVRIHVAKVSIMFVAQMLFIPIGIFHGAPDPTIRPYV